MSLHTSQKSTTFQISVISQSSTQMAAVQTVGKMFWMTWLNSTHFMIWKFTAKILKFINISIEWTQLVIFRCTRRDVYASLPQIFKLFIFEALCSASPVFFVESAFGRLSRALSLETQHKSQSGASAACTSSYFSLKPLRRVDMVACFPSFPILLFQHGFDFRAFGESSFFHVPETDHLEVMRGEKGKPFILPESSIRWWQIFGYIWRDFIEWHGEIRKPIVFFMLRWVLAYKFFVVHRIEEYQNRLPIAQTVSVSPSSFLMEKSLIHDPSVV